MPGLLRGSAHPPPLCANTHLHLLSALTPAPSQPCASEGPPEWPVVVVEPDRTLLVSYELKLDLSDDEGEATRKVTRHHPMPARRRLQDPRPLPPLAAEPPAAARPAPPPRLLPTALAAGW